MNRKLIEGLVETATILGVHDYKDKIGIINDTMDYIRTLEQSIKDRDEMIQHLQDKEMRRKIVNFNRPLTEL